VLGAAISVTFGKAPSTQASGKCFTVIRLYSNLLTIASSHSPSYGLGIPNNGHHQQQCHCPQKKRMGLINSAQIYDFSRDLIVNFLRRTLALLVDQAL